MVVALVEVGTSWRRRMRPCLCRNDAPTDFYKVSARVIEGEADKEESRFHTLSNYFYTVTVVNQRRKVSYLRLSSLFVPLGAKVKCGP